MPADLRSPKVIVLLLTLVLLAIVAGAGAGYLLMKPAVDEAEQRLAGAEKALASRDSSTTTEESTATKPAIGAETSGPEEPTEETAASTVADGRYPGIITSIDAATGGGWEIVTDWVQVLTGSEADAAAAARGDESPVPNDYYIINENPKLRTIPVSNTCAVLMHDTPAANPSDGYTMGNVTLTFDDFRANRWNAIGYYESAIYWMDVSDGVITNLEHFWVP
ncbi:MAG: hypothetical protein JXE06_05835 [Coriobacteriia bacterium]|nr:hypothetical protein [Coriobacteriia bacterium]MBN2823028.1 hypothetical protein [Coriobacteriia bacterium]